MQEVIAIPTSSAASVRLCTVWIAAVNVWVEIS